MLGSINGSNLAEVEFPKLGQNSSKVAQTLDIYTSHTEDLSFKIKNQDGDTYQVDTHLKEENSYHREVSTSKNNSIENATDSTDENHSEIVKWAKQIETELKKQQAELVKQTIQAFHRTVENGDGKFIQIQITTTDSDGNSSETKSVNDAANSDAPKVPEYWNAENTSDRIVRMATSFAKISGLDPLEFADKIKAAVQAGFDQAHDVTGDLPGAAGKLNQDTKSLVFSKLTKWLDQWKSEAYNQAAPLVENQTMEKSHGT